MNLTSLLVFAGAALALWLIFSFLKKRAALGRWDKQLTESEQLCGQLKDFGSEYQALHKKHAELFAMVDSIVKERNDIMEQYHRQASEHANAQDMMMREVKVLTTQYERLASLVKNATDLDTAQKLAQRPLRKNELLAQIAEDFRNEHVPPAVEEKRA
jgi:hypothetical protein